MLYALAFPATMTMEAHVDTEPLEDRRSLER